MLSLNRRVTDFVDYGTRRDLNRRPRGKSQCLGCVVVYTQRDLVIGVILSHDKSLERDTKPRATLITRYLRHVRIICDLPVVSRFRNNLGTNRRVTVTSGTVAIADIAQFFDRSALSLLNLRVRLPERLISAAPTYQVKTTTVSR